MKKVINIYHESVPVPLQRGRSVTYAQLNVGLSRLIEDEELNKQLLRLEKKGRVKIEDFAPTLSKLRKQKQEKEPPKEIVLEEDEDLEKLEQELLGHTESE